MRPEFVAQWPVPLSSDAFSLFASITVRDNDEREIIAATSFLYGRVILKYAEYFERW
jgi:hypothetical protein